ncbi:MAG: sigma-70 family RNA polymerase sigma factor [Acidobacteriota bacterium]
MLYETYKDKVYSISLYYFHGDAAAAADTTQQVFLKVMTGLTTFRSESDFSTWLYRLVVNTCCDRSRRAYQREVMLDPSDLERQSSLHKQMAPIQEDDLANRQEAAYVRVALSSLPPKLRLPILLRYFDDLSYAQLAEALDCSMGTVASRLNRGHEILRQKLASLRSGPQRSGMVQKS